MSGVQYSRAVKLAQICLRLTNIPIKIKEENSRIKLKTVCKLTRIIGRHWWLSLDETALIYQGSKIKIEYFKLKITAVKSEQRISKKEQTKRQNWQTSNRE